MKYQSAITHLECTLTGERFDASHPHRTNPANGKPLFARYDLDKAKATLTKESLADRPTNMWRYREVMPVIDDANIITLGEGGTPLLKADRLAAATGMDTVYIKDEGVNPTGSFKARGLGAAVSKAKELGQTRLTMPSAATPLVRCRRMRRRVAWRRTSSCQRMRRSQTRWMRVLPLS